MTQITQLLGWPLGWLMWLCYIVTNNYGISLLIFTLLIRLMLFPLSLKQQKSTVKMQIFQPQIKELQEKYKNNKEKLQEETMKLYQKEGYNPMSGCLPLLIQMPILFGLIDVIYRPLNHLLHLSSEVIATGEQVLVNLGIVAQEQLKGSRLQLVLISHIKQAPEKFMAMGADAIEKIQSINLNFLGMNLGDQPAWSMFSDILKGVWNPVILIPILSGVSALFVSLFSMRNNPAADGAPGANASMKSMMLTMPIFSTVIAFGVPAGVGLYWCYSNLASLIQTAILNKYYNPREMAEKARLEYEEKQERERQERIEAKKLAKESGTTDEKGLSQKELNRRKLAEARRRDAERYGEEYVEVTDEDLK